MLIIKQESSETYSVEESTSAVIGHLLHQPASVAKEIKQELINCAAHTITGRHTESCQIAQFVSDKGSSSSALQIEDVRSLLNADKAATVEALTKLPMVTELPVVTEDDMSPPFVILEFSASVNPEIDDTHSINPALCMVTSGSVNTSPQDSIQNDSILEISPVAYSDYMPLPLHGVMPPVIPTTSRLPSASPTGDITPGTESQLGATNSQDQSALSVVTPDGNGYVTISPLVTQSGIETEANADSSSNEPPTLSSIEQLHMVTDDQSLAPPVLTPISIAPQNDIVDESTGYVELSEEPPEMVTTISDAPSLTNEAGPHMTSLPKHNVVSVYYEVLNPEGDDIIHISHEDIMSRSCTVSVPNLSENDIKELQDTHWSGKTESSSIQLRTKNYK